MRGGPFPVFDEPAFKATFDIQLTVDKDDTVISNTNMIRTRRGRCVGRAHGEVCDDAEDVDLSGGVPGGRFQVRFGRERRGADPGVCDSRQGGAGKFAVSAAEYILHYYDNYFGIKYPMPKLDMIADSRL